jgi:hypothetical protein
MWALVGEKAREKVVMVVDPKQPAWEASIDGLANSSIVVAVVTRETC